MIWLPTIPAGRLVLVIVDAAILPADSARHESDGCLVPMDFLVAHVSKILLQLPLLLNAVLAEILVSVLVIQFYELACQIRILVIPFHVDLVTLLALAHIGHFGFLLDLVVLAIVLHALTIFLLGLSMDIVEVAGLR